MYCQFIILIVLLIPLTGMSKIFISDGQGAGNGGDAVVCRDVNGKITSSETLDRFEARVLRDLIPKGLDENKSVEKNYSILIERIEKFSPIRAKRYATIIDEFFNDSKLVKTDLIDIPDSEHVVVPRGCKIEQLVIQQKKRTPFDKKYIVQEQIWQSLNSIDQAIMVLHEAILDESIEQFDKLEWEIVNTRGLRYFNSLIFSFDLDDIYSKLTEEMIVKSLYMIPNISLVELKNFGQVVLKIKKEEGGFFRFVNTFNKKGYVDEVYLFNNDEAGTGFISKFKDITFNFKEDSDYFFYYHLKILDNEKMRLSALYIYRNSRFFNRRLHFSKTAYWKKHQLVFLKDDGSIFGETNNDVYQVDQTLILNYKTNKVIGYKHKPNLNYYKEYFPIGNVELKFYPNEESEAAIRFDSDKNRLEYNLCLKYSTHRDRQLCQENRCPRMIFKGQYISQMDRNCEKRFTDFGKNGDPLLPTKILVEKKLWGMWDSQKDIDKQFSGLPVKLNDGFLVHFQAQKLPKSWGDYKYIARDTFGLLIQKRSNPKRRKCLKVNAGSAWPVTIHKRWQSANSSCKLSSK